MVQVEAAGHARYTYRLRVSSTARTALVAEWDRCRWLWNECVAKSRAVYLHNRATGEKRTCGPAQLDVDRRVVRVAVGDSSRPAGPCLSLRESCTRCFLRSAATRVLVSSS